MVHSIEKIKKTFDKTLSFFSCMFVVAFCAVVILQVVCRSVTFLRAPAWTEELARYFFIYAVAFAGGLVVQTNSFVAVDILTNLIPARLKRLYAICLNFFLCLFASLFLIRSVFRFAFIRTRFVSTVLEIPMQWIYFALIILFGMLALTFFLETLSLLSGSRVKQGVPQ